MAKPLPESIKTVGDWIQVNRLAKNFRPGHLAMKMGIATALVYSWEASSTQPNEQQLEALAKVFRIALPKEGIFAASISPRASEKVPAVCLIGIEAQAA